MKFRQTRVFIGLIISLFFLYFAFRGMDWYNALQAFRTAQYLYVLPALGVYLLALWLRAFRWSFLTPPGTNIPTRRLFPIYILGCFANNILPLRMGDIYRAYILGRSEKISKSSALASIFIDKVFDALAVLTILGVSIWAFSSHFPEWEQRLFKTAALFLLTGVIGLWVIIWNRNLANKLVNWFTSHLPEKIEKQLHPLIHNFLDGLDTLKNHTLVLLAFFFSILSWLVESVMYYILALALGASLPIYASPVILAIVNLAMMLPTSPAGVGTFEFFCIKTSSPFFNPKSIAVTYAVFVHLAWFLPITFMGLFYMWSKHLSLKMDSQ